MNKKIPLYIALMVIALLAIPNVVSLYSGQHTFYSGLSVSCQKCHSDITSQLTASGYVYERHKSAAANTNYTTYLALGGKAYNGSITAYDNTVWTWDSASQKWQNSSNNTEKMLIKLDKNNNGIDGDEICMLCHNATLSGSTAHSGVVTRVCDDDRCHGNKNYSYNNPEILGSTPGITSAGHNLSVSNIHQSFYLEASNQTTQRSASTGFGQPGNEKDNTISKGYWTCQGCHTETKIDTTIISPTEYSHTNSNPEQTRYQ